MRIQNNGEEFKLTYGGKDITISAGLSSNLPDNLCYHVQYVAQKWNKDIKLISNVQEEVDLLQKKLDEEKAKVAKLQNVDEDLIVAPEEKKLTSKEEKTKIVKDSLKQKTKELEDSL